MLYIKFELIPIQNGIFMFMHIKGIYYVHAFTIIDIYITVFTGCYETSELVNLAAMLSEECVDEKSQKDLLNVLQIKKKVWDNIKMKTTGCAAFLMLLMHWMGNNKGSKTELEVQLKKIIFL